MSDILSMFVLSKRSQPVIGRCLQLQLDWSVCCTKCMHLKKPRLTIWREVKQVNKHRFSQWHELTLSEVSRQSIQLTIHLLQAVCINYKFVLCNLVCGARGWLRTPYMFFVKLSKYIYYVHCKEVLLIALLRPTISCRNTTSFTSSILHLFRQKTRK
jgi:hypothetical protein